VVGIGADTAAKRVDPDLEDEIGDVSANGPVRPIAIQRLHS